MMKTRTKLLLPLMLLCIALFALALTASAETKTGTCGDNLKWSLDTSTGALSITGTGEMESYSQDPFSSAPWYFDSIRTVKIANGVTSIGDYAFKGCNGITSITIPDSVTRIEKSAFQSCTSLYAVYITDLAAWCKIFFMDVYGNPLSFAHKLYLNGKLVTDLVIPDGVTSIGDYAFSGCSSFTSITIPNSVTSIGDSAFKNCCPTSITLPFIGESRDANEGYNQVLGFIFGYNKNKFSGLTEQYKGYYYDIPSTLRSVTVSDAPTIPAYAFKNCSGLTSITILDSVKSIKEYAFSGCSNLTSITIPGSVTSIGNSAFDNCSSLDAVYITDIAAWCKISFNGCSNPFDYAKKLYLNGELVADLVIPDSVTSIGQAFEGCNSITSITIPDSVTRIGAYAFSGCRNLKSITIPDSVTSVGEKAFNNTAWLNNQPDGVVYAGKVAYTYKYDVISMPTGTQISLKPGTIGIADSAFSDCSKLASITIPDSVTNIGAKAFYGCSSLASITIPDGVMGIGGSAFHGTAWLNNQPDGVVYVGKVAYTYKGSMRSGTRISLKPGTTGIADSAFSGCSNLASITIPDSVTNIGDQAFYYCRSLTSITIPDSVTSIGDFAFEDCRSLTSITIPDAVTSIGVAAFRGCSSLTSITIPDSVTNIGNEAFSKCSSLTSITIPDSVTNIGNYAFRGCSSLTSITILNPDCQICNSASTISSTAAICGYDGSTAEAYATKHNRKFISLGHIHVYADNYTVDVPASCTATGEKSRHCTYKGCTKTIDSTVIPAAGHKFGRWKVRTPAKCEETGVDYRICTVCTHEETRTTDKLGHSYATTWTVDTPANCTTPGSKSHHCIRCDAKTDITTVPVNNDHDYSTDWTVDTPANCTTPGSKSHHCTRCDAKTDITTVPVNDEHDYSTTWTVDTPANCTTPGSKSHHCTRCDAKTDITAVPVNDEHDYSTTWTVDTPANCTAPGSKSHHCTRCNAKTDITEIPKTAHTYVDGICKGCGKVKPPFIPGVVTGEGEKPAKKDLLRLQKYLAGWDVEIVAAAADCNGDGQISKADLLRLQKYLAGWDVKLGE